MKLWSDEGSARFWTFVAGIAGLISIALAVYIFHRQTADANKRLEVQMLGRARLVDSSVSGSAKGIKVAYEGREVPNYELIQIRVVNVGGQPITPSDFAEPLSISLTNVQEVLSAEQSASDPPGLAAKVAQSHTISAEYDPLTKKVSHSQSDGITVSPLLLNPTDSFTIAIGVIPDSQDKPSVSIGGRIVGVKKIEYRDALPPANTSEKVILNWVLFGLLAFSLTTVSLVLRSRLIVARVKEYEAFSRDALIKALQDQLKENPDLVKPIAQLFAKQHKS